MDTIHAELKDFIKFIQEIYSDVTDTWLAESPDKFNLKKTLVSDIQEDTPIYKHILHYHEYLSGFSAYFASRMSFRIGICQTAVRVKARNSIYYKIRGYKTERHGYGKVPINKCLNDLFGARIILPGTFLSEQIQAFVSETFQEEGYRCYDSSKMEYRATHLYFRDGNFTFPWELQIWNACDAAANLASHKKYKQEYITWEKEDEKGGTHSD